ncbi:hypothetical protein RSAG8_10004, partial [Rhizoctonia solani AG-8 WAC10335]
MITDQVRSFSAAAGTITNSIQHQHPLIYNWAIESNHRAEPDHLRLITYQVKKILQYM